VGAQVAGGAQAGSGAVTGARGARPVLKQYREKDGLFYFKLQVGDAEPLLQSLGFADPKACGACIGSLKADPQGWAAQQAFLQPVPADRQPAVVEALQQLAEG